VQHLLITRTLLNLCVYSNRGVTLTGVRLRSWRHFAPHQQLDCDARRLLFNTHTLTCVEPNEQCAGGRTTCARVIVPHAQVRMRRLHRVDQNCRTPWLVCHKFTHLNFDSSGRPCTHIRSSMQVNITGQVGSEILSMQCATGYLLHTNSAPSPQYPHVDDLISRHVCEQGRWMPVVPDCLPVDCAAPPMPHAQFNCSQGTLFSSVCQFDCVPPARMIGENVATSCDRITCKARTPSSTVRHRERGHCRRRSVKSCARGRRSMRTHCRHTVHSPMSTMSLSAPSVL
jgi:hypothetical protein